MGQNVLMNSAFSIKAKTVLFNILWVSFVVSVLSKSFAFDIQITIIKRYWIYCSRRKQHN